MLFSEKRAAKENINNSPCLSASVRKARTLTMARKLENTGMLFFSHRGTVDTGKKL